MPLTRGLPSPWFWSNVPPWLLKEKKMSNEDFVVQYLENNVTVSSEQDNYKIKFSVDLGDEGYGTYGLLNAITDVYQKLSNRILENERKGWIYL